MGETGTETTKREGGTENDRVTNLGGSVKGGLNGGDGGGLSGRDINFWLSAKRVDFGPKKALTVQSLTEEITIF